MQIEKLEVEEGFLDGLVLDFSPGLNVIIGPRGTGKTSIVELIRFCLDVDAFTSESQEAARTHALSVLGTGRVALTLRAGRDRISVLRAGADAAPRRSSAAPGGRVTVLSQKEIEQIGLDAFGRLRLIDDFAVDAGEKSQSEAQCASRIRSLTSRLQTLASEIAETADAIESLGQLQLDLKVAQEEESRILGSVESAKAEQEQLEVLSTELDELTRSQVIFDRSLQDARTWRERLRDFVRSGLLLPEWPGDGDEPEELQAVRTAVRETLRQLGTSLESVDLALSGLMRREELTRVRQAELGDRARELRRSLDAVTKGAGAAAARVALLRERLAVLQPTRDRLASLRSQLAEVQEARREALDEMDEVREARYRERCAIASTLNERLGPRINVGVIRYGFPNEYTSAIANALRGTRLHYNQLAPILARAVSPRELVEAAENGDVAGLTSIAGLDADRAARVVEAVRADGGQVILTAPLEDAIELRLLDGSDYKPSDELSTGQRCTVVLPILLEQHDRVLVIDQPEDHLDNGFIVETVVRAIRDRSPEEQIILATHNANIPVLGDARQVIVLDSDGRNGFVSSAAPLEDDITVAAIERIMEGGREAFALRAAFYHLHASHE